MRKLLRSAALFSIGLVAGCGSGNSQPSFEEFQLLAHQEADTGFYVVDGDELVETADELRAYYDAYVAARPDDGTGSVQQGLIVNRVGGRDDKWSSTTARNLTYCIGSNFGSRKSAVVSAMNSATGAWEGTANVNFVYSSGQDGSCSSSNNSVVFNVRQVSGQGYLARSFFPSSSRRAREVLIDSSSFGRITPYTLTGILRHELGHTIGFRHEHTRPEAGGVCFEDNSWRALTSYDSASVMHYPQCNGTNRGDLVLTSKDKSGARSLYP
jgi:Dual-action HEIGH metallo-peptidase